MRHERATFLAALVTSAVIGAATAQAADRVHCHSGGGYLVIARERTGEAGTDFLVRAVPAGGGSACVYERKADDFVLDDPSKPYWFKDIRGDYLILTASTGPTENVVVFDLQTRRKVMDLAASDLAIDDRGIYFWARTDDGTPETCKRFAQIKQDGLTPVIETRARFIFAEARMIEIRTRRCVGAQ